MPLSFLGRINQLRQQYFSKPMGFPDEDVQRRFLDGLEAPRDDIERSYLQYLCQKSCSAKSRLSPFKRWMSGLLVQVLLLRTEPERNDVKQISDRSMAAFIHAGVTRSIIPVSLQEAYQILDFSYFGKRRLTKKDRRFFRQTVWKRYKHDGDFCLKLLLRMEMYAYVLSQGTFQAVITHSEYSYASSFLTEYCRRLGVEHINVMHGDKLYYIRDAFFHFDRCYIWDEYYRKLFCALRAEPTQFRVELPPSMQPWEKPATPPEVDLTYYLQGESPEQLRRIAAALHTLQVRGMVIAVRPHPRYTPPESMRFFQDFLVEDGSISIEQSVLRTKRAVSRYSTVLLQASINGVSVVIDDLTEPERFAQLRSLRYIMLDKPHELLSALLQEDLPT